MSDKPAEESFTSPYLERPLRSMEEVLRGLPRERRLELMNIVEGSPAESAAGPEAAALSAAGLKRTA